MWDTISFLEGIILGGLFVGVWFTAVSLDSPHIQRKLKERQVKKDIFGRPQKTIIVPKVDPLDEEINEITK